MPPYTCARQEYLKMYPAGEGLAKVSQNRSVDAVNAAKTVFKPTVLEQPLSELSDLPRRSSASCPACMHAAAA